ncbi:MAG: hypothetical protein HRT65_07435 [Flavobacteriaceae bacterium]|uniref:hypothetical protein n=1 Tax=Flagellimonas algarum TaxID=3230298 RepID=UPI0033946990|nr:hypothetical protein [Flavobacteriaceae bacterium]
MEILTNLHSYMAYAVLFILFVATSNALMGWLGNREFKFEKDLRVSLFALILSHLQLVIGLIVYFVSSNGFNAIQELGMGGMNAASRLLALEHPLTNILAIALITVGWSRHKKKTTDKAKFKSIAIFYLLGLVLILSRIPWGQWFG